MPHPLRPPATDPRFRDVVGAAAIIVGVVAAGFALGKRITEAVLHER